MAEEEQTDFFQPVFESLWNRLLVIGLWFPTVTLGSLQLVGLIMGVLNDQYGSLLRHLYTHILYLTLIHNHLALTADFVRVFAGPLPEFVCSCVMYWKIARFFLTLLVFGETHILRLLYCTWWKNAGYLNDSFVLNFLGYLNGLFVLHVLAGVRLFEDSYSLRQFMCTGQAPLKTDTPLRSFLTGFALCVLGIVFLSFVIIRLKQRSSIQPVHAKTWGRYPPPKKQFNDLLQVRYLHVPIIVVSLTPDIVMGLIPWDQSLNGQPKSILLILSLFLFPCVMSVFLPKTLISRDQKLRAGYLSAKQSLMVCLGESRQKIYQRLRLGRVHQSVGQIGNQSED